MSVDFRAKRMSKSHLDVQADIPNLEGGVLADVDIDELGGVLVEDVDMPQAEQQQLLPKGRGQTREREDHD